MHFAFLASIARAGQPILYDWIVAIQLLLAQMLSEAQSGSSASPTPEMSSTHGDAPIAACPPIITGTTVEDRRSTFQAHVAVVHSRADVDAVLAQLMRNNKIARATHNIYAYRIVAGQRAMVSVRVK